MQAYGSCRELAVWERDNAVAVSIFVVFQPLNTILDIENRRCKVRRIQMIRNDPVFPFLK